MSKIQFVGQFGDGSIPEYLRELENTVEPTTETLQQSPTEEPKGQAISVATGVEQPIQTGPNNQVENTVPSDLNIIQGEDNKPDTTENTKVQQGQSEDYYNVKQLSSFALGTLNNLENLTKYIADTPLTISTQIPDLDHVLGGGLPCGITVVAASPGIGKTTLLLQSAAEMARQGTTVVYVSYDMRSAALQAKVISHQSYKIFDEDCYTIRDILKDNVLAKSDDDKVRELRKTLVSEQGKLHIRDLVVDDDFKDYLNGYSSLGGLTQLQKIIEVYCQSFDDVVIMIDSLQQLAISEHCTGKEGVDRLLAQIKVLSGMYNVPICLVSTLARSGYTKDKDIGITDLKESGAVEYDADAILIMQPAYIKEGEDITMDDFKSEKYRATLIKCVKSRHSEYREKVMMLYGAGCTFISEDEYEQKTGEVRSKPNGKKGSSRGRQPKDGVKKETKRDDLPENMGLLS
ncbi:DnaB-like helicase C-terminal domain-containing protein [Fusibacter ferrireducens]|uniref:AAA family ATPase n=1 Tax=Fusibacter ferrireducens TaxID=2785058 RepID=A0ABR9ZX96_9FIRM|nr:DnaB-like helicase C-terminal domain-containing protein [Fusibacter ferrireducens]MBF4695081.1 AAA family ATPase [Fusibacter ferrireducens]